jgi:hypothetical protein
MSVSLYLGMALAALREMPGIKRLKGAHVPQPPQVIKGMNDAILKTPSPTATNREGVVDVPRSELDIS